MNEIYKFSVLEDLNLVIQYHQNKLTLDGLKQLKMDIITHPKTQSLDNYDTIVDIRFCSIECTFQQLQSYRKYISSCYAEKKLQKVAILSDNPKQVALATIFTLAPSKDYVQYKIFSSMEGALKWLNRPLVQEDTIEAEIKKLHEKDTRRSIVVNHLKARWDTPVKRIV